MVIDSVGTIDGFTRGFVPMCWLSVDYALKNHLLVAHDRVKGYGKLLATGVVGQRVDLKVRVSGRGNRMRLKIEEVVGLRN